MENKNLNLNMVRNIFDVRVREIQRTHLQERDELILDLRRRGLMSIGVGYDEIIKLFSKQIEQQGQIYLDALFQVVDYSNLHINNDLCAEMTNAVENMLDSLYARASQMIRANLARDQMYGEIQESTLRGLRFETQDIKDHLKKKIIEFEFHNQNKTPQGATNSQKHSDKSGIKSFPLPEGEVAGVQQPKSKSRQQPIPENPPHRPTGLIKKKGLLEFAQLAMDLREGRSKLLKMQIQEKIAEAYDCSSYTYPNWLKERLKFVNKTSIWQLDKNDMIRIHSDYFILPHEESDI